MGALGGMVGRRDRSPAEARCGAPGGVELTRAVSARESSTCPPRGRSSLMKWRCQPETSIPSAYRESGSRASCRPVRQLEDLLVRDDLGERPVRRLLARHRSGPDSSKRPSILTAQEARRPESAGRPRPAARHGRSSPRGRSRPPGRTERPRRRGSARWRAPGDVPVDVGPVEAAVDGDHLAVEMVERAEPEVAMLGKLGKADVTLEGALEQRPDRGSLKSTWGSRSACRSACRIASTCSERIQRSSRLIVRPPSSQRAGSRVRAVSDFGTSRWSGFVPRTRSLRLFVIPCQKCSFLKWWRRWLRQMVL